MHISDEFFIQVFPFFNEFFKRVFSKEFFRRFFPTIFSNDLTGSIKKVLYDVSNKTIGLYEC